MLTESCAFGLDFCLTRGEWVSLWGGVVGAIVAFAAAVTFEGYLRWRKSESAVVKIQAVIADLKGALEPWSDGKECFETAGVAQKIINFRTSLIWAAQNPDYFSTEEWINFKLLLDQLETWLSDNRRLGGFMAALYNEQIEVSSAKSLASHIFKRL